MFQRRFKKLFLVSIILFSFFAFFKTANAQMMGNSSPSVTPSTQDIQDIQTGQNLYNKFQSKQLSCSQLKDNDFEKIGEYIMNQRFSNTNQHIQMNNQAKQMMGENGEEQMHIQIAKSVTGCDLNGKGGSNNMMSYGGYGNMMGGNFGVGYLGIITWIVVLVDLILLGIWLWKQINKK